MSTGRVSSPQWSQALVSHRPKGWRLRFQGTALWQADAYPAVQWLLQDVRVDVKWLVRKASLGAGLLSLMVAMLMHRNYQKLTYRLVRALAALHSAVEH